VLLVFKLPGRHSGFMVLLPAMSGSDSMTQAHAAPPRSPTRPGARTNDRASNPGQQPHPLRYDFLPMVSLYNLFYI
jgi:hypothetical protein